MDDVEDAILRAWSRVAPRLAGDGEDLLRRLRRRASLTAPPRAWCLAIRASDTRLRPDVGQPVERGAWEAGRDAANDSSPNSPPSTPHPPPPHHDTVTLYPTDLRTLCAPVSVPAPGETIEYVAGRLGTTRGGLLKARVAGVFGTRYVRGIGGRWGKPRPLLYTPAGIALDPAGQRFRAPDPLWSWTGGFLIRQIDDDLPPQTLARVLQYHPRAAHLYRDGRGLHPEHPANDGPAPARPNRSRALPPVPPWAGDECAGYKWRDGQYLGYDRDNPAAAAGVERAKRRNRLAAEARRRRRLAKGPAPRPAAGSLDYRGLRWLCPACGRATTLVYLPMPPFNLLVWAHAWRPLVCDPRWFIRDHPLPPRPIGGFACKDCHRVRHVSHTRNAVWNEIVTYLTGGLLYGHEVERPAWLQARRRNAYAPRPTREPSRRRPQIERGLLAGRTISEIAAELGLAKGTVLFYTTQIYRQHGVGCLKELLIKHGLPLRPHLRGKARGPHDDGRGRVRKTKQAAKTQVTRPAPP